MIRRHLPAAGFYEAVAEYRQGGTDADLLRKLTSALDQLEQWTVAARHEALPALVRRIIRETGAEPFAAALPGGQQRVATLRALTCYAVDFAESGQHGVAEFVSHLEQLAEQEVDPGALVASGSDVIRIMTIHAAKGLEAGI